MMMIKQFETERFDLVKTDRVRISGHRFGHNKQAEMDVWIDKSKSGERFLSQLIVQGKTYVVRKEVYTTRCYILREKATGSYYFLDKNDCGFWLHTEGFFGATTFFGDESVRVQKWIADAAQRQ
jgi:hypothetical protein